VIGLSATQVNILVNTIFASHEVGANTWLQMAFRLMQLPLGVFGVAIATVAGAGVAQRVAAGDMDGVRDTLGSAMRLVAFLNVPAAVGLIVLAHPIISLVYEHGRFDASDASATAEALVFYAMGLYGYSAVKVFAPAFYALDEVRVPVVGSIVGMASNVILVLALHPVLGFRGIALGTALAATANFAVLAVAWKWRHGGLGAAGIYRQLARTLAAAAVMIGAILATRWALLPWLPVSGLARQALLALVPIATGATAYFLAAGVLGVKELGEVASALRRGRRGGAVAR
jgi:putative peptidoglycan lipid II flippase